MCWCSKLENRNQLHKAMNDGDKRAGINYKSNEFRLRFCLHGTSSMITFRFNLAVHVICKWLHRLNDLKVCIERKFVYLACHQQDFFSNKHFEGPLIDYTFVSACATGVQWTLSKRCLCRRRRPRRDYKSNSWANPLQRNRLLFRPPYKIVGTGVRMGISLFCWRNRGLTLTE